MLKSYCSLLSSSSFFWSWYNHHGEHYATFIVVSACFRTTSLSAFWCWKGVMGSSTCTTILVCATHEGESAADNCVNIESEELPHASSIRGWTHASWLLWNAMQHVLRSLAACYQVCSAQLSFWFHLTVCWFLAACGLMIIALLYQVLLIPVRNKLRKFHLHV